MALFENLSLNQRIRASLHRDVRNICTETCHFLGLEMSKSAMDIVFELIYNKISVYGTDLEAFAKHAKRTTINSEDVKLLARRNTSLKEHLSSISNTTVTKDKRRKTASKIETKKDTEKTIETPKNIANIKNTTEKAIESLNARKSNDNIEKTIEKTIEEFVTRKDKENKLSESLDEHRSEDMMVDDIVDLTFD